MILNGLLPRPKNRPHSSPIRKKEPVKYDQWTPKTYRLSEEQQAYFSRLATPSRVYKPPVVAEPISPKLFGELPPEKVEYYNRLSTRRVFKEPEPHVKKSASECVISEEKQRYYASLAQPLRVAERADKKKV